LRVAILAIVAALVGARSAYTQTASLSEYQVKAAFLYHFAQFVDWPPEALKDASGPLTYCTIGEDPFHGALDAALNGKAVGAHSLQVRHVKQIPDAQGCQVLFIGEKEKKELAAVLSALHGNSLLIVGESEHFAQEGGTIGFSLEENKIGFEINLDAAAKAKLKISSKLLALAKNVIGGPKGS
jgi:hypothetical protein